MTALSVQGLSKRYGAKEAVRDVGFEVGEGEIFGLIGPNGAGKTTTLEMILGLVAPDGGRIAVDRAKLGAQLQTSSLPDAMTPRQALKLCGAFYPEKAPPAELIERFQLTEKADARYSSLSGGQKQRLALALAFVNRPNVVVLDEPTAGLDVPARKELHELIRAERAAGKAILFTTHYLEEARGLCDRVALINAGRLVALDTPDRLIAASAVTPRIVIRTSPSLEEAKLKALPGVTGFTLPGTIETGDVPRTLAALALLAEASQAEVLDLQVIRPTLDDAFMKLTA